MTENVITGNTPFTIEAWVKYDGGGFSAIINRGITTSWVYNMYGTIAFGIYLGEPPSYVVAPPPTLNQWHHIAGVRTANGELYIFVDGFKLGTLIVGNNNLISNQTNLKFGKYFGDSFFKGSMTKIRISKIARYTNNFVPTTNYQNDIYTVGLWKFEEGSGTILHDASSNNIHGTIYGTPEWSTDYPTSSGIWEKDLLIVDNGGQNKTITYGQSFEATDSLDVELGEYELPPVPPTGVFDVRFNLPTTPIIGSLKDIRNADDTSIVWTMTFQPGISGYPITFDWSSGTIPDLGNYFLKDYFGLVNVNMRSNSSYTLTNPAITALKIEAIGTVRRAVNVLQGWNMLSVPVNTLDMSTNILFPGATSNFFGYNNGYEIVTLLQNSKGYWAKYNATQTFQVQGNLVDPPDVLVNNDWNIIGPFDYNVPVADITSTPGGIIATNFFGFNNGYQIADTLKVGKGYWVRANSSGTLHLNNLLMNAPTNERQNSMALLEANFTVTDGAGGTTLLMAGIDSLATDGLDPTLGEYEIPPLPPAGVFDARFNLPSSTISTLTDIRQGTLQVDLIEYTKYNIN